MVAGAMPYIGRFAPSPTGPLHAGSLVAALASWLDARAHGGQWLVRLEDVDTPRCVPGADRTILAQLAACGLHPDEAPVWQSQRSALYQWALDVLVTQGLTYPCTCSRKDIELALQAAGRVKPRHGELIYPGTCRTRRNRPHGELGGGGVGVEVGGVGGWAAERSASCPPPALRAPPLPTQNAPPPSLPRCAWRLRTDIYRSNEALDLMDTARAATELIAEDSGATVWTDRRLGSQQQNVAQEVGDFVLKRADGCYTYQLAVVVDDAAQNITHVVRGEDLTDNTARQIVLQQALGLPTPAYLHTPLVRGANGEKLSKQNGAQALDTSTPEAAAQALVLAAGQLELPEGNLSTWVAHWQMRYGPH